MRNTNVNVLVLLATIAAAGCGSDDSAPYVVGLSTPEETSLPLPLIPTHPADGTPRYEVTTEPKHGTLDGAFPTAIYTPATDFNGTDEIGVRIEDSEGTVDLTLQITVTPVNDAPTTTADVVASDEDTTQMIAMSTLLANDMDIDGDALTIIGVPNVRFGAAVLEGGHIKFTPALNFNGSATLTYTVSDGHATATGVVTVSVGMVNDAPVAFDDYLTTDEDTQLTIDPSQLIGFGNDSDADGQALTVTAVDNVQGGTASVLDGIVTFTPDANFTGDATFNYTVSDGALTATALCTVTVAPVNDAPVAVPDARTTAKNVVLQFPAASLLTNDTDVEGDSLSVTGVGTAVNGTVTRINNNTTIRFTPATNFVGAASFMYTITDGNLTATAKVNVTVTP
jgi:hypothetical protein